MHYVFNNMYILCAIYFIVVVSITDMFIKMFRSNKNSLGNNILLFIAVISKTIIFLVLNFTLWVVSKYCLLY
jgi:high-affinity K+ transport system ATPase subunit B